MRLPLVAMLGLLAMATLAGCTAGGGDNNLSPHADLEVNDDNGWTTDDFVFDAQDSKDPDGSITHWRFDFGDGTPAVDVDDEDQARVTHRFPHGGQFTVTLTVTDDGKDNTGSLTDNDAKGVTVNERVRVAATSVSTLPGNASSEQPFQVYDKADRFEMNVTVRSALVTGSSEFRIRVVDPDGDTLDEQTVSVGPGSSGEVVNLDGVLTKQGAHKVTIEATSGAGTAEGELRVLYG